MALSTRGRGAEVGAPSGARTSFRPPRFAKGQGYMNCQRTLPYADVRPIVHAALPLSAGLRSRVKARQIEIVEPEVEKTRKKEEEKRPRNSLLNGGS